MAPEAADRPDSPTDLALWPADVAWRSVSPTLIVVRRLGLLAGLAPLAVAVLVAAWSTDQDALPWLLAGAGGVGLVWGWWAVGRAVRSWGYAERDDDLLVRHGVLIRRLSVVPYGRMQFVDVTAGPVERMFGLTTVQLHTAAAASDAVIPGLVPEEAARLRDRLAALGQTRAAGL